MCLKRIERSFDEKMKKSVDQENDSNAIKNQEDRESEKGTESDWCFDKFFLRFLMRSEFVFFFSLFDHFFCLEQVYSLFLNKKKENIFRSNYLEKQH